MPWWAWLLLGLFIGANVGLLMAGLCVAARRKGGMAMNVKQIVREYLEVNGYDGLFCESDCGCKTDDLAPCGESCLDCEPGCLGPCDCGEHDWHIVPVVMAGRK